MPHIARGIEGLVAVVQELSLARSLATVQDVVRQAARALTGADGATFVLRDGDACVYADEDASSQPLPLTSCIGGWAMVNRQPAIVPDVYHDHRVSPDEYRPAFVKSLVMVPIGTGDPIGAIGTYWAEARLPTDAELSLLETLADSTAVAMENVADYAALEQRVADLSVTDDLTGLHNRRGFLMLADQELKVLRRSRRRALVLCIAVDGAGDAQLASIAELLRCSFRDEDVIARTDSDEFAVFIPDASDPRAIIARLQDQDPNVQLKVGASRYDPSNPHALIELLSEARTAQH